MTRTQASLEREFQLLRVRWPHLLSYNIAPTQQVPAVRIDGGIREGVTLRWGLIPHWANAVPGKFPGFNTRLETLTSGAMSRDAWRRGQRCILPALGFYEWQVQGQHKQPYYIHSADKEFLAMAGVWDRSISAEGVPVESCSIITMPAGPLLATIHNTKLRQPLLLDEVGQEAWLTGTAEEALAAAVPYPDERLLAWPVSRASHPTAKACCTARSRSSLRSARCCRP